MAEINDLSAVSASELKGSDLLVVFSNSNGDSRKISLTNYLTWLNTNFTNDSYTVEAYVPTTGQTLTVTDDGLPRWLKLIPATTLASLTVTLPASASSTDGQEVLVTSTEAVTALTVNGNGSTVNGAPASLSTDGAFVLRYNAIDTAWYLVSGADNLSDAITADASGNVLVGKTSTSLSSVGFEIQQSGVVIGTRSAGRCMILNRLADDGTIIDFMQNDSVEGSISISGSTTAYNTTSDYRLKENVTPLTGATDRLKQIPVNIFNFIAHPDRTVDGFLAHEVQAVVPEAVQGVKDAVDDDGVPVYQQIDQSKLVPLLVATIQELEARITALEA